MAGFTASDGFDRRSRVALSDQERRLRRAEVADLLVGDGRRLIIRSPNGHFWNVTIDDAGALVTADLGTTAP